MDEIYILVLWDIIDSRFGIRKFEELRYNDRIGKCFDVLSIVLKMWVVYLKYLGLEGENVLLCVFLEIYIN